MNNIGIIGKGFVGTAVAAGFSPHTGYDAKVRIYDVDPAKSTHSLHETVNESEVIFVSVPTPASKDGAIDLSIIHAVLKDISSVIERDDNIILIRSTIVPGTSLKLQKLYPKLNIVFNPEFLTERSAHFDFINQARVILGGDSNHTEKVAKLYKHRFGAYLPVIQTTYETAELIKYMNNLFFATKVSFLNEMLLVAEKVDADWEMAVEGFILDGRIGHSHVKVPGHDGKRGFGGSCFPKDIQAMINFAKDLDIDMNVLEGAWKTNLQVRPEKDWENLKGRAVSEDSVD
ncbi:MAG: UDP-glucose/GDP-mannose dehydrogenase family protein [Flavobacteriales bacterium TMED96]|nr:MAG: UDP-glucose/GDP-mannose dehydrogenase family protein [Flavobacteriales bacterium TMED96]|tara:strand:+ start:11844 stop:12707 length:864 start_codon:yes stop_codon:yes gene_type:complete